MKKLLGILLLGSALAAACTGIGDAPLDPQVDPLRSDVASTDGEVHVLERLTPLDRDITVSANIGSKGGSLAIKEVGLVVTFPKNAVSDGTTMVVTAKAGNAFLFDFGPSPQSFANPVKIEIDVKNSLAYTDKVLKSSLKGAYFPDSVQGALADLKVDGKIKVTETYTLLHDAKTSKVVFYVDHFSGYLLSVP